MNKLKFSWILWGIIMVVIVILLFCVGKLISKNNKPYKDMESEIVEVTKRYVEGSTWYPEHGQHLKVDVKDLKKKGLIEDVVVDKDSCDGYIKVQNNGIIEYKAYLKCKNYTTHGYEE